jgi:hypothetical protein
MTRVKLFSVSFRHLLLLTFYFSLFTAYFYLLTFHVFSTQPHSGTFYDWPIHTFMLPVTRIHHLNVHLQEGRLTYAC